MGALGRRPVEERVKVMVANREALAGTDPERMADELAQSADAFSLTKAAQAFGKRPALVLSADDGLAEDASAFAQGTRNTGNERVTEVHAATDHSWNDRRVFLATTVVSWLQALGR
jgi:hypothetical protein